MNKTKIEWCDSTWNPVTGCLHGCEYCYARRIAERFAGHWSEEQQRHLGENGEIHDLENPMYRHTTGKNRSVSVHGVQAPYPFGFEPTFHGYRLEELRCKTKGRNIFVCSMADLLGKWVPDEWIYEVLNACEEAPRHNYLFLTKNPERIQNLRDSENWWFGTTCNSSADFIVPCRAADLYSSSRNHSFISLEPLQSAITGIALQNLIKFDWVIVGAETGNRKEKVIPKKEWIDQIALTCKSHGIPIFMKNSLLQIMGEQNMLREFPEELKH
ncbi:MAG: DUF5131 family protein [Aminipila sp.]